MKFQSPRSFVRVVFWAVPFAFIFPAWCDYEIYRKKGFEKVAEIVEKKENPDGTFTVKARRKGSQEVIELFDVVEIKDVPDKPGAQMAPVELPTPTPIISERPGRVIRSAPAAGPVAEEPVEEESINPLAYVRSLGKVGTVFVIAVLGFFIIMFVLLRSSS